MKGNRHFGGPRLLPQFLFGTYLTATLVPRVARQATARVGTKRWGVLVSLTGYPHSFFGGKAVRE